MYHQTPNFGFCFIFIFSVWVGIETQKGVGGTKIDKKNSPTGGKSKTKTRAKKAGFQGKVGKQVLFLKEGKLLVGIVEKKLPGMGREWTFQAWEQNEITKERERCNIKACEKPVHISDLIPSHEEMGRGKSVLIFWSDVEGKFLEMSHAIILAPLDNNLWLVKPRSHHAIRVHTTEIILCPDHFRYDDHVDTENIPDKVGIENVNILNLYVNSCEELLDNLISVRHDSKLKIQASDISEKEKNTRIQQLEDLFRESQKEISNLKKSLFEQKSNSNAELRELKSIISLEKSMLCRYQKEIIVKNKEILELRRQNLLLSQRLNKAERECAILKEKQKTHLEKRPGPNGNSDGFFQYRPADSASRPRLAADITMPEKRSAEASDKVLERRADELNKVRKLTNEQHFSFPFIYHCFSQSQHKNV